LKPGGQELYDHMRRVSEAVSIPVMIQYAPEQTGVPIDPNVFKKLKADVKNILYYKIECKPPGHYISRLLDLTHGDIRVFVGNAGFQMIEGFDRGASGVMPGPSMFDIYVQIFNYYRNGKRAEAIELHKDLVYMLNHIRQNVEMIINFEKYLLKKRGFLGSEYCRQPTYKLDEVDKHIFEEIYQSLRNHFINAVS
jgi:dihydrodipicolinate synthase/N-acetylneuraminate lyase